MSDAHKPSRLLELVPIETLESLRRLFEATLSVPIAFTDTDGEAVTTVREPLAFCGTLVRCAGQRTVCLRREKWDVPEPEVERALKEERDTGEAVHHRCSAGFQDTAVPIEVEGETIGYAVFARSLTEPPDVELFRQLAVAAHMDPDIGEEVAASALVMSADEIGHVAEFLRIITALVARAANDTIRAARVFQLEKLRDDMMDMIVHDLRTPLTGVMSSLQTIEASQYDAEIVNEFVPAALESSRMLLELVNTLLDVSKLETGQITLDIGPLRFEDIVREAVAQVKPLADDRSHELHLALDRECPVIQADEDMLRRTLVNLLANAIKFTPRGGRVGLSARCDEMGLTFSVSDNGPGIPPEYRDKIFDKFGQVETRKAGPAHSTGIGLTFCKLVADAHGGRIWLDTEVGKGSRFFLFIPFQPPQQ